MKKRSISWERPILIGSCPSSGSTLLSVMLDAHSDILCGPELSLFSHPFFWSLEGKEWQERLLHYISLGSLALSLPEWKLSNGVCPYALLLYSNTLPWYGITLESLKTLVLKCSNARELVSYLYTPVMESQNKIIWAEKSPPNIYSFGSFLERYPEGKVIYLVRDGRDVICSLHRRNFGFKRALSIWLVETAISEQYRTHPRVHRIKYEDLVLQPRKTVEEMLEFLDLPLEVDSVLNFPKASLRALSADASIDAGVSVWRNNPRQALSDRSVGTWKEILSTEQHLAFASAAIIHPVEGYAQLKGETTAQLFRKLDYKLEDDFDLIDEDKLSCLLSEEGLLLSGNDYRRTNIFQERFVECDTNKLPKGSFSWKEIRIMQKLDASRKDIANANQEILSLREGLENSLQSLADIQSGIVSIKQELAILSDAIASLIANQADLHNQIIQRTDPRIIIKKIKSLIIRKWMNTKNGI